MAKSTEKTVSEAIQHRRSVRVYNPEKPIDTVIVKKCLEQASLAPTSSNLQLWEFYHITSKETIQKIAPFCFNQNAASRVRQTTHSEMLWCVVVPWITRQRFG